MSYSATINFKTVKEGELYLYHEEDVVYISMFGGYEIAEQKGFVHKCRKAYEEWQKQFEKPKENEETENE